MEVFTPLLERTVELRPETTDEQVWADTFTGLYHVPPRSMPEPRTVLDLGANIGLTAAHYRMLWPDAEIVAVEMDRDNADLAEQNAPGVKVRQEAVAVRGGGAFYEPGGRQDSFRLGTGRGCRRVQCLPLRKIILRSFGLGGVDFVKMDIEGVERDLLRDRSWQPLVRFLVVELHEALTGYGKREATKDLAKWGFEVREHPPHPQALYARR